MIILTVIFLAAAGPGGVGQARTADRDLGAPYASHEDRPQAPFGNELPAALANYARAAPYVAVSGRPTTEGLDAVEEAGFALVIDLRGPDETGVAEEAAHAEAIGLDRAAMPFPQDPAEWAAFLPQISARLDDPQNYPILLNCGSGNRAAAVWALYRAEAGVPKTIALEEARAVGLSGKEAALRAYWGMAGGD